MTSSWRKWVQRMDLNHRPSGYEPDELPGCSTLQIERTKLFRALVRRDPEYLQLSGGFRLFSQVVPSNRNSPLVRCYFLHTRECLWLGRLANLPISASPYLLASIQYRPLLLFSRIVRALGPLETLVPPSPNCAQRTGLTNQSD